MWWRMADWVKRGGSLPDVPELVAELTAPTYDYSNAQGKFALESKDEIKRLGNDPDKLPGMAANYAYATGGDNTFMPDTGDIQLPGKIGLKAIGGEIANQFEQGLGINQKGGLAARDGEADG